jgi:antitoxin (DNA-binding transcriptional repressor) of toxin-antitoxin stability system
MSRKVTVEELKDHIDVIIAAVKAGESITIVEGGRSIATVGPVSSNGGVRSPFRNFDFGARPAKLRTDVVDLIREDRDSESEKYGI